MAWARVLPVIVAAWAMSAGAQTLPWPGDQPLQSGPAAPSGAQQALCALEMTQLAQAVETFRAAANKANARKAKREEVCRYLTEMAQTASRLLRYATANGVACGLDASALSQIKDGGQRAVGTCRQVCILDATAGRLDDVPPQFASPMPLANSNCGDP